MTISPIKISPKTTIMTPTSSVKEISEPSAAEPLMPLMQVYMRRKFFEPKLMSTPPPIAEQFLYDLRKMISVARERIRNRRHVPRLPPVAESDDETTVSITTANGNCIITGSLPTKSEQIQIKEDKNITPNICLNNKENSRKEEKEELKNAGNLQQKRDYLGENKEEKGEEIINEEKKEIIEEEKIKEEKELKPFFEEEEICSETKIDLFNENFELNEIMENKEVDLVKEEKEIIKKENEGGELNENNEILDNEEIEEFKKEIVLENGKEEKEEVKKDEEMPIEEWLIEDKQSTKTPSETSEEEKTKPEHIENKKEVLSIPQNISEHLNNNIPPSRIPSAIPSTINGKSPRIPLKFSSSALNRKTTTNNLNNYVKPPPLPPRPPPQINGQNNGNGTPVMKESFLTVMAAKRKAATGIARRQKQCGRQVFF
uniref:WH2 domain-containing protein n=1 Tax=Meloidogyne hapla TaxID=6305 RepID=A0A1I8BNQ8_MELHA